MASMIHMQPLGPAAGAPDSYLARAHSLLAQHADYFREMDVRLASQRRATVSSARPRPGTLPIKRPGLQLALPLRPRMRR
jgi:hypothetical protein